MSLVLKFLFENNNNKILNVPYFRFDCCNLKLQPNLELLCTDHDSNIAHSALCGALD